MNHCTICGHASGRFRAAKRQTLCNLCDATTPKKVSREQFELVYWNEQADCVPYSTRAEFYSDYLTSTLTLEAYVSETTEAA